MRVAFQDVLGHIRPHSTPEVQEKAAGDVAKRLLGEKAKLFVLMMDPGLGSNARNSPDAFKVQCLLFPSAIGNPSDLSPFADREESSGSDRGARYYRRGDHGGFELLLEELLQCSRVVGRRADLAAQRAAGCSSSSDVQ